MEIDQEVISSVILLPSAESFKKGCCQLQTKLCAQRTGYLFKLAQEKVWLGELIVLPWPDVKQQNEQNKTKSSFQLIQEGLLSVTSENMCTNNWLTA